MKRPTQKQLDLIKWIEYKLDYQLEFTGKTRGQAGKFIRIYYGKAVQQDLENYLDSPAAWVECNGIRG